MTVLIPLLSLSLFVPGVGVVQVKEFGCAVMSPSGVAAVVGNYNKFYVYAFNSKTGEWEETKATAVPNLYSVTALGWKSDGRWVVTAHWASYCRGHCASLCSWL